MQILNAIREHYLMKREADHGSQLFYRSNVSTTALAYAGCTTLEGMAPTRGWAWTKDSAQMSVLGSRMHVSTPR